MEETNEKLMFYLKDLKSQDFCIEVGDESLEVHLFSYEEFKEGQIGYRMDEEGNSLISKDQGNWQESWYVIGYEEDLGDPLIVDVADPKLPVLLAAHGEDFWEADVIFESFLGLLSSLGYINL